MRPTKHSSYARGENPPPPPFRIPSTLVGVGGGHQKGERMGDFLIPPFFLLPATRENQRGFYAWDQRHRAGEGEKNRGRGGPSFAFHAPSPEEKLPPSYNFGSPPLFFLLSPCGYSSLGGKTEAKGASQTVMPLAVESLNGRGEAQINFHTFLPESAQKKSYNRGERGEKDGISTFLGGRCSGSSFGVSFCRLGFLLCCVPCRRSAREIIAALGHNG